MLYKILSGLLQVMISTVGNLRFERTYCKDIETGEYRYLLDEIIKHPKHERFTPLAEAKAIYDSTVYSYQDAEIYYDTLLRLVI